jgi:hypothetical protein
MRNSHWFRIGVIALCLMVNYCELYAFAAKYNSQLKGVRIRPEETSTQVIFEVSNIPEDLKVQSATETGMTATFTGDLSPALKAMMKSLDAEALKSDNLKQVYWEQTGDKVQIFLKMKMADAATFYPLRQPDRLVFNIRNGSEGVLRSNEVTPGVKHTRLYRSTARGPLLINVVEVDPKNQGLEILPVLANGKMVGKARVETIARQNNAIAGVNGSFFKPDQGIPLGLLIINEELITGPLYDRVAMGITSDQRIRMDRVGMRGDLTKGGQKLKLDNVNQPRTGKLQTVLYTSRWGAVAPKVPDNGIQLQLLNGKVLQTSTTNSLSIPTNGYVVSGPLSSEMMAMISDPSDTAIGVSFYTVPDWSDVKHAISGGPYLVKNGNVFVDTQAQRFNFKGSGAYAPRTAVGITGSGKMLLVTVDGRQKGVSVGLSIYEMAHLMKQLGVVDAMNLDGGSSTQMVVDGRLVNSPSVSNGVGVSNCLIVRPNAQALLQRNNSFNGYPYSRTNSFERSLY